MSITKNFLESDFATNKSLNDVGLEHKAVNNYTVPEMSEDAIRGRFEFLASLDEWGNFSSIRHNSIEPASEEIPAHETTVPIGTLNSIDYQLVQPSYGINGDIGQWAITASDTYGNIHAYRQPNTYRYIDNTIYNTNTPEPLKKHDRVRTPKGDGSIWLIESDIVCVELDAESNLNIVHEFEINEIEKIK